MNGSIHVFCNENQVRGKHDDIAAQRSEWRAVYVQAGIADKSEGNRDFCNQSQDARYKGKILVAVCRKDRVGHETHGHEVANDAKLHQENTALGCAAGIKDLHARTGEDRHTDGHRQA